MKIWVTRHGQTDLNKEKRMQGRATDAPLNENGIEQARRQRARLNGMTFDAVIASPLQRAVQTGAILGGIPEDQVLVDERLLETEFGRYEQCRYCRMGPAMSLYWALPELFPAPKTVENLDSMRQRSASFLREIEGRDYENVLLACHGGIMRALCGFLSEKKNGIVWRPKPKNCEIRVYEYRDGSHRRVATYPGIRL